KSLFLHWIYHLYFLNNKKGVPLSRPTTKAVVRCPRTIAWRWALISPLPFTCYHPVGQPLIPHLKESHESRRKQRLGAYQSAPSNLFLHPRA
ncbi:hypothetical protein BCR43DRAFT_491744, partial [Syncephalastrum racemosum]